jgi:putative membrane protein
MMFGGLIIIALLVYFIIQRNDGNAFNSGSRVGQTPIDILKERFARGEIDEEEYERKKKML